MPTLRRLVLKRSASSNRASLLQNSTQFRGSQSYWERGQNEAPSINVVKFPGGISIRHISYYPEDVPFRHRTEITDPSAAEPYVCVEPGPYDCQDIARAFSGKELRYLKDLDPTKFPAK